MGKSLESEEEQLTVPKGPDVQPIFDTKMEPIRNFHMDIPTQDNIPAISTVANRNPVPILPTRPCATAPPYNINGGS
jgi:hypothetical protein